MRIFVTAKTKAKKEGVVKIDDEHFIISVNVIPEKGKANARIATLLARYFHVASSHVVFLSGRSGKKKVFEIK